MKQARGTLKPASKTTIAISVHQNHQVRQEALHREKSLKRKVYGQDIVGAAIMALLELPEEQREQHVNRWLEQPDGGNPAEQKSPD